VQGLCKVASAPARDCYPPAALVQLPMHLHDSDLLSDVAPGWRRVAGIRVTTCRPTGHSLAAGSQPDGHVKAARLRAHAARMRPPFQQKGARVAQGEAQGASSNAATLRRPCAIMAAALLRGKLGGHRVSGRGKRLTASPRWALCVALAREQAPSHPLIVPADSRPPERRSSEDPRSVRSSAIKPVAARRADEGHARPLH